MNSDVWRHDKNQLDKFVLNFTTWADVMAYLHVHIKVSIQYAFSGFVFKWTSLIYRLDNKRSD